VILTRRSLLAVPVAAVALLSMAVGVWLGDASIIGLAVVGALLAVTTFRAAGISTFLRIFATVFAVEYVVFGLVFLAGRGGLWPAEFADFVPPSSLPVTVGIFGILVYLISFIPVIRTVTRIADPFFESNAVSNVRLWPLGVFRIMERRFATAVLVSLVLINQAQVAINVRLSFFNRDWFNAIQNKDAAAFWSLLLTVFAFWATIFVVSAIVEYVIQSLLTIRWRRWLTDHYVGAWLGGSAHYRMALTGIGADNPDQRIAVDIDQFITRTYGFSVTLLSQVSTLVSFSIILWAISASFTIPGTEIAVPGFLFWVALGYALLGTTITHLIGRSLIPLFFNQQRYEADFRFTLARMREYGEQIALLDGEPVERRLAMGRFGEVVRNFLQIVNLRKKLMAFTSAYGQISTIIPYVVAAPFYFAGRVQLGVLTQTAGAFARVEGSLSFFVDYYVNLADYKAVIDRLTTFDAAIATAHALGTKPPRIEVETEPGRDLRIGELALGLPGGRTIVRTEGLVFRPGERTLLTGPSGSGKSTLFRAIAGVWPFGAGRIAAPAGASMMLLPQRPYIPIGSLRGAVTYPGAADVYDEAAIREALRLARLPHLADKLDAEENWAQRLSGGEQQRLAVARALLARPDWLFLDEATAALDEGTEEAIYRMLAERLPDTTIVSIGHRSTLAAFHDRRIDMRPGADDGLFTPIDQRAAVAAQ
jgi:vitamin B12/bleomycin/antimicrobial peptide transport system ATP-binding/permease protein